MVDPKDVINKPIEAEEFSSDNDSINPEDVDLGDEIDIGDDEIDPIGDDSLDGEGSNGLDDSEFDNELEDDTLFDEPPEEPQMVAPEEQVKWTTTPQENGDIWSEHESGFILRARPLSAQQGPKIKYIAQLFKNKKMVDKGVIWIDKKADATEVLQNVADRTLDTFGLVNYSKQSAKPEADFGGDDFGGEEVDLGDDDGLGTEGDLGLDDLEGGGDDMNDAEVEDDLSDVDLDGL